MQSIYLDTAIAIVFVFLLFSVIAYVIQERIAAFRKSRAKMLEYAISEIFKDAVNLDFDVLLYEHPQIDLLRKTKHEIPSYIPAANFAVALIDIIGKQSGDVTYIKDENTGLLKESEILFSEDAFERFKRGVELLKYSELKILLGSFLQNSGNYDSLQASIINWFDEYMNRVSGWYKKGTRNNLLAISVCLVIFFNIDAIYLIQNVFHNSQLRSTLVAAAERTVDQSSEINKVLKNNIETKLASIDTLYQSKIKSASDSTGKVKLISEWTSFSKSIIDSLNYYNKDNYNSLLNEASNYDLPIGWTLPDSLDSLAHIQPAKGIWAEIKNKYKRIEFYLSNFAKLQNNDKLSNTNQRSVLTMLFGWLIAAVCISFGAPFWFDLLGKLVNTRRAGIKPADSTSDKNSKSK